MHPSDTAIPSAGRLKSRLVATSPVYYGWVVLAAATLTLALSLPGQTAAVSLFIDSFIADLGVSRGAVSLAYTVATLLGAALLPWLGRALDRFGPRAGGVVVAALFSAACFVMSTVQGLLSLFVGFFMLRAFGQSGLGLVSVHAVNLWFVRRRGFAVGLMGGGIALTMGFGPLLLETGITSLGWRSMYLLMGLVLLTVLIPTIGLLFRQRPERYGLAPDGPGYRVEAADHERSYTLVEARSTGAFWMLVAGVVTTACIGTGLLFHHIAIMGAGGVDRAAAALVFIPFGLVTLFSNLGAGVLVDRFAPRRVLAAQLLLFSTMVATIPFVQSTTGVWLYGIVFGLAQGLQNNLAGSAFAYYFGREHIGAIKGFAQTLLIAGTAVGPPLIAFGKAALGSYAAALWVLALIPLVLGVVALVRKEDAENG
jgi:MFS family permease